MLNEFDDIGDEEFKCLYGCPPYDDHEIDRDELMALIATKRKQQGKRRLAVALCWAAVVPLLVWLAWWLGQVL